MLYSGIRAAFQACCTLSSLHLWADCQVDDGQHFAGALLTDRRAVAQAPVDALTNHNAFRWKIDINSSGHADRRLGGSSPWNLGEICSYCESVSVSVAANLPWLIAG
jgi:hypothetical protein